MSLGQLQCEAQLLEAYGAISYDRFSEIMLLLNLVDDGYEADIDALWDELQEARRVYQAQF